MKFAVIRTGGKQYKVSEGETILVERLSTPESEEVIFADVLLVADGENIQLGKPVIDGLKVNGRVLSHPKGEKIRVSQYKAKARYRRVNGHRQALSEVKIESIGTKEKKEEKGPKTVKTAIKETIAKAKTTETKLKVEKSKTTKAK